MEKRNRFLKIAVVSAGLYCLGTAGVAMPSVSAASTVSAGDTAVTAGGVSVADGTGRAARAEQTWTKRMGTQTLGIEKTDPELAALMKGYIYGDIACQAALTPQEQDMVTLAVLTVNQDYGLLCKNVQGALQYGVTPLEIRETLYHMAPYIGFPRVIEAVEVMNGVFRKNGIRLPLDAQGTTTDADRFAKGLKFQVDTYGERITRMRAGTPDFQKHLQDDLSAFCFGDIYTRGTLDLKTREMITVAAIGALGNDSPQFISHVRGYLAAGATQNEVVGVLTVLNPYVGFPRTLNMLREANSVFTPAR